MPVSHESVVYDVDDFKVYAMTADTGASPTYSAAVDVPGINSVSMDPNVVSAEVKGDGRVIARRGRVDRMTCSAQYAKVDIDVLPVILGGWTVDQTDATFRISATTNNLPYFKAAFKITNLDVGVGDLHVTLFKCQITGGTLIGVSADNFGQPSFDFEAIAPDSHGVMVEVSLKADATALPA
jgi:hypothetical protein